MLPINHSPENLTPLSRFKLSTVAMNVAGITVALAEFGFGLFMMTTSKSALEFLFKTLGLRWSKNIDLFSYVFFGVTGLMTGLETGLAGLNFQKVIDESKENWQEVRTKKVPKVVLYLNAIVNVIFWATLSMSSPLAFESFGLNLSSWRMFLGLSLAIGIPNFFNYLLVFVSDIIAAPYNFNNFLTQFRSYWNKSDRSAFHAYPPGLLDWVIKSFFNVVLKSARQGYMGMSGVMLITGLPKSHPAVIASWVGLAGLAAWETFFTQCWRAWTQLNSVVVFRDLALDEMHALKQIVNAKRSDIIKFETDNKVVALAEIVDQCALEDTASERYYYKNYTISLDQARALKAFLESLGSDNRDLEEQGVVLNFLASKLLLTSDYPRFWNQIFQWRVQCQSYLCSCLSRFASIPTSSPGALVSTDPISPPLIVSPKFSSPNVNSPISFDSLHSPGIHNPVAAYMASTPDWKGKIKQNLVWFGKGLFEWLMPFSLAVSLSFSNMAFVGGLVPDNLEVLKAIVMGMGGLFTLLITASQTWNFLKPKIMDGLLYAGELLCCQPKGAAMTTVSLPHIGIIGAGLFQPINTRGSVDSFSAALSQARESGSPNVMSEDRKLEPRFSASVVLGANTVESPHHRGRPSPHFNFAMSAEADASVV